MVLQPALARLRQHTLYARLLLLLLCMTLIVILTGAGTLFLFDYIPSSQSTIERIYLQKSLWDSEIQSLRQGDAAASKNTMLERRANRFAHADSDATWLVNRGNPELAKTWQQLQRAQRTFENASDKRVPLATRLKMAVAIDRNYDVMGEAVKHAARIRLSTIALLQLVGALLMMACIVSIGFEAKRVIIDRLDRLVSFIPNKLVDVSLAVHADEFSRLEQKVYGAMARLEGYMAEAAWANRAEERLNHELLAQRFFLEQIEAIHGNEIGETTLHKMLDTLEALLEANNAAFIFDSKEFPVPWDSVLFSRHWPCAPSEEVYHGLAQTASTTFLSSGADGVEVRCLAVALMRASDVIGVLVIEVDKARIFEGADVQLLEGFMKLLSMALRSSGRDQEGRRIALLEERTAIARELHDSLAQSLSFMKIQIARLQANAKRSDTPDSNAEVISDLREGLDNAYRELRGLLATFRVHMDVRGLGSSIRSTIDEFSRRSRLSITLDNRLGNCQLTANEEFHILHVVHEALSNIVRHSNASAASLALIPQPDGTVAVTIDDNGTESDTPDSDEIHYGLTTMQERAHCLGGDFQMLRRRGGGVRIRLAFTPSLQQ